MGYRNGNIVIVVALSLLYFITAYLGLRLDAVSGFATLVWPPSGISLAATLLFGYRVWPGIALGAFSANVASGAPWGAALGIAFGNTAEALVGAFLLNHFLFDSRFCRLRDLGLFLAFGVLLNSIVSASFGAFSLWIFDVVTSEKVLTTMGAWWVGDAFGSVIVAPLLLASFPKSENLADKAGWIYRFTFYFLLIVSSLFLFCGPFKDINIVSFPWTFLLFPFVVFSAIRFGAFGAASTTFIISVVAISGTTIGLGAFTYGTLTENLLALHGYIAVIAVTGLLMSAAFAEVRTANQAKSAFLANMSHEIRTPLGAILGFTELLRTEPEAMKDKNRYLDIIYSNGQLLMNIISDILDMSKVEAGKLEIVHSHFNLAEFFNEINLVFNPSAALKGLNFFLSLDSDLPKNLYSDPMRLKQIILNIIGNAIKFTSVGGVTVNVQRLKEDHSDFLAIYVRDTGIGVPEEFQQGLFQAFQQGDNSTTRKFGGTGLGLMLSRQLANAIGGDVVLVESRENFGSTFLIKIKIPTEN